MAPPGKKSTKADKSNVKKRTVNKKTPAKKTPAKKNTVEKASSKRTPTRGLLKEVTKKTPAKKVTALKSGRKVEASTKKTSAKVKETKKTPTKKVLNLKGRNKKEALTKKISSKMNSAKTSGQKKKETKKTAGMKNPVIMIKSVDVSPSSSEKEPTKEKEMSVEVSSGKPSSADDDAASQASAAKSQKTTVEEKNSGSASTPMATSSNSMPTSSDFDLATFVESRLGAINSPGVAQELSGSEKSTLGDLINHNMRLAHNLYEVREETILETALVSLLPDFEVEESSGISSVAKAAHREVVQYRDLLLLQKVETISEAQRTGWNLAASNLSDTAQVALMVSLLGLATKLTGMKPVDSFSQVPGGKVMTYSREEVEAYLAIFDSVTDEMAEGWKDDETNLPVKRRMLADLNTIIQNF